MSLEGYSVSLIELHRASLVMARDRWQAERSWYAWVINISIVGAILLMASGLFGASVFVGSGIFGAVGFALAQRKLKRLDRELLALPPSPPPA